MYDNTNILTNQKTGCTLFKYKSTHHNEAAEQKLWYLYSWILKRFFVKNIYLTPLSGFPINPSQNIYIYSNMILLFSRIIPAKFGSFMLQEKIKM